MKIYLAGPMSGKPNFNFPAFLSKASELREQGHEVFNPAERDLEEMRMKNTNYISSTGDINEATANGFSLGEAMADDLNWIARNADGIYLLKGWEQSSGALSEWMLAKCLRLQFFYE